MKAAAKPLIKEAESLGFCNQGANSKGMLRYSHPSGASFLINPSCSESQARHIRQSILRAVGKDIERSKRNPAQVRERQAREAANRRTEMERLEVVRDDLIAARDRHLSGLGAVLTSAEVRQISEQIEAADKEYRRLERLMTSRPESGAA